MKRSKKGILVICIVFIAVITLLGLGTFTLINNQDKRESEVAVLKDELSELKGKENAEFRKNGFSEEYYKLENQIKDTEKKISKKDYNIIVVLIIAVPIILIIGGGILISFATSLSFAGVFALTTKRIAETSGRVNRIIDKAIEEQEANKEYEYKEFKCPNCGASLGSEKEATKKCKYCGASLHRVSK